MEFRKKDILFNVLETYPTQRFLVYQNQVYYKNQPGLTLTPQGHVDLYELNLSRTENDKIYPFITKASTRGAFSTVSSSPFAAGSQFNYGDVIKGKYPMTASIRRVRIPSGTEFSKWTFEEFQAGNSPVVVNGNKKFIVSLRNTLEYYSGFSKHFKYKSENTGEEWYKGTQQINMFTIPSIFFGNKIKKKSVRLGFYVSGNLKAELHDVNGNGELVEVTGSNLEKVAGVVMYDHGFILLTGSWDIHDQTATYDETGANVKPKWVNFAAGMPGPLKEEPNVNIPSASYSIQFDAVNPIPTLTMFAHARKNQCNMSSNPSYLQKNSNNSVAVTSNKITMHSRKIKNIAKSPFKGHEAKYEDIVYISKIGIYDEKHNLLAIANLANPIKKTRDREYTFKLKLDF